MKLMSGMWGSICIIGIIRLVYMIYIYTGTYDVVCKCRTLFHLWRVMLIEESGYANIIWGWTMAECQLGIICASAPALKPFFAKYLGGVMSSFWSSRKAQYHNFPVSDEKSSKSLGNTQDKDLELQTTQVYSAGCTQFDYNSKTNLAIPPQTVLKSTTINISR